MEADRTEIRGRQALGVQCEFGAWESISLPPAWGRWLRPEERTGCHVEVARSQRYSGRPRASKGDGELAGERALVADRPSLACSTVQSLPGP